MSNAENGTQAPDAPAFIATTERGPLGDKRFVDLSSDDLGRDRSRRPAYDRSPVGSAESELTSNA